MIIVPLHNLHPYTLKLYTPSLNRMAIYLYVFFGMCLYVFLACVFVCVFVCLYVFWCFVSSACVNEQFKKRLKKKRNKNLL
jgi:ABC-type transport system involved in cytochrome bd biosynthesis fused ATPase/permease subunit